MRRINVKKAGTIVHVETPNGIINIHVGLTDAKGRWVDAVTINPNRYAGEPKVIVRGNRLIRTNRKFRP